MTVDFFQKEVEKVQRRFNEVYGEQIVCNLKLRKSAILSICCLGMTCSKIKKTKNKDDVRSEIKKFMKLRNILNNFFNQFEEQKKERRDYGTSSINERRFSNKRNPVEG